MFKFKVRGEKVPKGMIPPKQRARLKEYEEERRRAEDSGIFEAEKEVYEKYHDKKGNFKY